MQSFNIQFDIADIAALAARYQQAFGAIDAAACAHAARILARKGDHCEQTRADLLEIMAWKSERRLALLAYNNNDELFEAVEMALGAKNQRSAMAVLCGLDGVGVPMASAIMTAFSVAMKEEKYTIIDWRALRSLGVSMESPPLWFYLEYLDYCFDLSAQTGHSLRTIDRALWQWSLENPVVPRVAA